MTNKKLLTIAIPYRDRDIDRVERCLSSLANQTFKNFEAILVDDGSLQSISTLLRTIMSKYDFCRYIYTDTRGYPWNKARALNIAGRLATTEYLMLLDIDLILPRDLLALSMNHMDCNTALYVTTYFLPKDFRDWVNIDSYANKLPFINCVGGCVCIPTNVFKNIRGFDEYYQFWGREDADLAHRLIKYGLHETWSTEYTRVFHQWHPVTDQPSAGYLSDNIYGRNMPYGTWSRKLNYSILSREKIIRNSDNWGHIHKTEERQVFRYLDPDEHKLIDSEKVVTLDLIPDDNISTGKVAEAFYDLPSGHALAVNHAFYPRHTKLLDVFIKYTNKVLDKLNRGTAEIDYRHNLLHSFLYEFIENQKDIIADYFLGLKVSDGLTVLVRT